MTAEQARREDEEYFNRVDAYTNLRCCEDCKDDSDPVYSFYDHRLCKFCITQRLKDWTIEAVINEIATEPHMEELEEKDILIDFITENLEVFYG